MLLYNGVRKELSGKFLCPYIGRAFHSGKALFIDLSKPQLSWLDLIIRLLEIEQTDWNWSLTPTFMLVAWLIRKIKAA